MFPYFLLICLLPQAFGAWWWWHDMGTTNCKNINSPLTVKVDKCGETASSTAIRCNNIFEGNGLAKMKISFRFQIDHEFKTLPVLANYETKRFPTPAYRTKLNIPEDACKNREFYDLKESCPLKPGIYTIHFPLEIPNRFRNEWLQVGLGVYDETKNQEYPFVCSYVDIYTR
uniref:Putative ml domain salivary peptide n=1 Tax=Corethrella appendiculata TaxID=1370023 RepID=U5ECT7_9DIPT